MTKRSKLGAGIILSTALLSGGSAFAEAQINNRPTGEKILNTVVAFTLGTAAANFVVNKDDPDRSPNDRYYKATYNGSPKKDSNGLERY